MSNKIFIFATILFATFSVKSETHPLNIDGANATLVGIQVNEISTGQSIYEYNSEMTFIPASVMKVITTASVMSKLGTSYKYETTVNAIGTIKDSVFIGDIVIGGVGDPTIDSRYFPNNRNFVNNIVTSLKNNGINTLQASYVCNSSITEEGVAPHWQIEDVAWGYGTGLYGVNYLDNTFDYYINQDSIFPPQNNIKIQNHTTYGTDAPIMVRGLNSSEIVITGTIPNRKHYKIECATPHPEDILFNSIAKNFNITDSFQTENVFNDTILLYKHHSPSLKNIMRSLMVRSDNLYAEAVLRLLATDRSRTMAIKNEINMWNFRGLDTKYISINDGCGISRINKLTPQFISDVMMWMATSKYNNDYVYLFPRAGKDGTLKNFLKGTRLSGKIALKTGSMNGIQTYAGYKLDASGKPTHTVVIMVNSFFCKRYQLIKEIERLLLQIF